MYYDINHLNYDEDKLGITWYMNLRSCSLRHLIYFKDSARVRRLMNTGLSVESHWTRQQDVHRLHSSLVRIDDTLLFTIRIVLSLWPLFRLAVNYLCKKHISSKFFPLTFLFAI